MKAPVLAIAIPRHHDDGGGDDGDTGSSEHDGDSQDIAAELADLVGVPAEKQDKFAELLHAYVKACEAEEDSGEHEEGGGEY